MRQLMQSAVAGKEFIKKPLMFTRQEFLLSRLLPVTKVSNHDVMRILLVSFNCGYNSLRTLYRKEVRTKYNNITVTWLFIHPHKVCVPS